MSSAPSSDGFLRRVRWLAAALGGLLTLGSVVFWRLDVSLGVIVGSALAVLNLWALERVGARMLQGAAASRQRASALFALKFGALAVAVFLVLWLLPVHPLALMVGLSVAVVAIAGGVLTAPRRVVSEAPAAKPAKDLNWE